MAILTTANPKAVRLSGPVDERRFVEATGDRAALFGYESGRFECWIWPLKIAHELELKARRADGTVLGDAGVERSLEVTPGSFTLDLRDARTHVSLEVFVSRDKRAVFLLAHVEADEPVELELSFRCDFKPMWPAGLGGCIAARDPMTGAFLLTEELGRFACLIGSPEAEPVREIAERSLPERPITITVPVSPARAQAGPIPFVLAGAQRELEPLDDESKLGLGQAARGFARAEAVVEDARTLWREMLVGWSDERRAIDEHWESFLGHTTVLETGDEAFDAAHLWGKIAIERAWVQVDGLGRGLVAGIGSSGNSERPGYAWFFDGDAMFGARALNTVGAFGESRDVLHFAASHQREDGKLMHELTLSAGLCDWVGEYPYAYYKGVNNADFVSTLDHYFRWTGDTETLRDLAEPFKSAFSWCTSCLDERHLPSNKRAGLAAVEAGPLSDRIENELFLVGAWMAALRGAQNLGPAMGSAATTEAAGSYLELTESALDLFWSEEHGRHGFALLEDGQRCDDLTVYTASPLRFLSDERAFRTALQLNRPELCADWGARMFATDSSVYDPESYNTGAVFPYLTSFSVLALYAHRLGPQAFQQLSSLVALTGFGGLGFVEEHLVGDRAEVPTRGVAHQVFSSAAVVEGVASGLFGLEPDAARRRLDIHATLPPHWDHARLGRVLVGEALVDLELRRVRDGSRSRLEARITHRDGGSLDVGFSPRLPALSLFEEEAAEGALEPGGELVLALEGFEGPDVLLPSGAPGHGAMSGNPRLSVVEVDDVPGREQVRWKLHGLGGSSTELYFTSGRNVQVEGATFHDGHLRVRFPGGTHDFVEQEITLTATD